MRNSLKLSAGLLFLLSLFLFSPAYALADSVQTQIGGNTLLVPDGHSTESVVAIDTDAKIAGTVTDVVFVIRGNVYLESTAHVDLVIALGGHVYNSSERPLKTGVFEFNFTQELMNQLMLGMAFLFGIWLTRVILSSIAIILLSLLGYLLKTHISKGNELFSLSMIRLFGVGTGSALILICLSFLLSLTVIGIPIAIILLILSLAAAILGLIPIIDYMGTKLLAQKVQEYPSLTKWFIQTLLFVAIVSLPLAGLVFLFITGITGLGLMLTLSWMYFKSRRINKSNS